MKKNWYMYGCLWVGFGQVFVPLVTQWNQLWRLELGRVQLSNWYTFDNYAIYINLIRGSIGTICSNHFNWNGLKLKLKKKMLQQILYDRLLFVIISRQKKNSNSKFKLKTCNNLPIKICCKNIMKIMWNMFSKINNFDKIK